LAFVSIILYTAPPVVAVAAAATFFFASRLRSPCVTQRAAERCNAVNFEHANDIPTRRRLIRDRSCNILLYSRRRRRRRRRSSSSSSISSSCRRRRRRRRRQSRVKRVCVHGAVVWRVCRPGFGTYRKSGWDGRGRAPVRVAVGKAAAAAVLLAQWRTAEGTYSPRKPSTYRLTVTIAPIYCGASWLRAISAQVCPFSPPHSLSVSRARRPLSSQPFPLTNSSTPSLSLSFSLSLSLSPCSITRTCNY